MKREFVLLRKTAIVVVAIASVIGAVGAIWILVTRGEVTSLSTLQLLAMLALVLLPGATFAAWELDRRAAHNRIRHNDDLFDTPEGVEVVDEPEAPPEILPDSAHSFERFEESPPAKPGRTASPATGATRESHRRRRHESRHSAGHG